MKAFVILTKLCVVTVFIVFLSACQSSQVMVDYDTETDFSTFRVYDWHRDNLGAGEQSIDPLMLNRIKEAVESELMRSSLSPASQTAPADILVLLSVYSETYTQESGSRGSIGFGSGGRSSAIGIGLSLPLGSDSIVKETHIVVDMIGITDNKLKWRGSRTVKTTDESPQQLTPIMGSAVAEIFSHYPPSQAR